MSKDDNKGYEIGYSKPPKHTRFGAPGGNNINRKGRKKIRTTFEDEVKVKAVFGAEMAVKVDGETKHLSSRQIIIQQIANGAAKGDPVMIRLAIPFMKIMDDAPAFEPQPEDQEIMNNFKKLFNSDGSAK